MAKQHSFWHKEEEEELELLPYEQRKMKIADRCLESIEDLLQALQVTGGKTVISIQQEEEMENIIRDARVQGLLS